jgi:CheY-like chemotaxis protein
LSNHQAQTKGTVLYIDDDPLNLRIVQIALGQCGYRVIEELDAQTGIVAAQLFNPDAIILDVMLPWMSGLEVARHLKQDCATKLIPLISLTADDSPETRLLCENSGCVAHLTKPVNLNLLQRTVTSVIENHQMYS